MRYSVRRHIVVRVVSLDELRARVAASYDRLGMPSWPNPHPGKASPTEEEYSRVTDAGRYRIVHARARMWAGRLGKLSGVQVEVLAPAPLDAEGRLGRFDRGVRVTSSRPGTLPLLLLERDTPLLDQETSLAVLHASVVRPEVVTATLPNCGCDACDWGSDDLLDAVDQAIGNLVGGPFVALRRKGWYGQWHPGGGSSCGTRRNLDHARMMELCRRLASGEKVRLPRDTEALVGRPWFD
jgi:hypothetical protein